MKFLWLSLVLLAILMMLKRGNDKREIEAYLLQKEEQEKEFNIPRRNPRNEK